MSGRDADTLGFYAAEAEVYAGRARELGEARLRRFAGQLPARGKALELGCGGGQDSEALLALGLDVSPTDGSPELAAEAQKRLGRPVSVLLFEDLVADAAFDGVWANACLLHVPRPALPGIVARVHRALRPGGVFYASYKAGEAEGRDRFGRYYNYPDAAWLRTAYGEGRWSRIDIEEDQGGGYDQEPTRWLHATAIKLS
ncbi:class I SAM-dependent methyltransferase [Bosea sp. (in: a-proteobacteria)]|jgi:SAM-dependent methyltransferase|uniref:class I SAM-dependent methyltransferase n=1 Tax=Bosea sp. (in: a-proteobacteria) TaxID=1871050 RepID=UPI002DDCFE8D|nr:class I SAM-dependent methyltransferase [Bosea sp. (in: a-proteobacteria)]HEV2509448.1 class I SAM-dependent methyltransferase [Bosea sp. (in: a-proteobacteria)]